MMETKNAWCVILAGGKGKRLWPSSREQHPKQFIDFFGSGRTLLQQTYDRMKKIFPAEHILINTNQAYLPLVHEQLPEVKADNIMAEPIHRNTAPSVAWATHRVLRYDPDAVLLVTPSDQLIQNEDGFGSSVQRGLSFVEGTSHLLTLAVRPTRPEPGYGYIQLGDQMETDVYKVQSFTEKPDRQFAKLFVESGEFFWNTGLFIATARTLADCFVKLLPSVLRNLDELKPDWTIADENAYINDNYPSFPNVAVDLGVLEKCDDTYVMRCDFGWADVGTWHGVYEALQKGDGDNVAIDTDALFDNARGNVVKLPHGRLAVINGLEGYIVAEKDNVLLICRKEDSSALVRKYVNEVQIKRGEKYV